MGRTNELANQRFTEALEPGEVLVMTGIGAVPKWEAYALLGITSKRVLLVSCPPNAWSNAPSDKLGELKTYALAALTEVTTAPFKAQGTAKRLVLRSSGDETNVVLMQEAKHFGNVWNYTGFDGHQEFYDLVPEWLAQCVAKGAFAAPDSIAAALEALQTARAGRADQATWSQQAAVRARGAKSIKWPYILMLLCLLGGGLGAFMLVRGKGLERSATDSLQTVRSHAETPGDYLNEHPDAAKRSIEEATERLQKGKDTSTLGMAVAAGCAGGLVVFLTLGIVVNKRKRARLAAA